MGKFRNGVRTTFKQLKVSLHEMVHYVHVILKVLHVTLLVLEVMDILVENFCNTTATYIVCIRKKMHNDGKISPIYVTCKIRNPTL